MLLCRVYVCFTHCDVGKLYYNLRLCATLSILYIIIIVLIKAWDTSLPFRCVCVDLSYEVSSKYGCLHFLVPCGRVQNQKSLSVCWCTGWPACLVLPMLGCSLLFLQVIQIKETLTHHLCRLGKQFDHAAVAYLWYISRKLLTNYP